MEVTRTSAFWHVTRALLWSTMLATYIWFVIAHLSIWYYTRERLCEMKYTIHFYRPRGRSRSHYVSQSVVTKTQISHSPKRMETLQPSLNFGGGGRNAFLFVGRAKRMGFALLIGPNPSIPPPLYLLNIYCSIMASKF